MKEQPQKEEELFPEIAEEAKKDLVYKLRGKHKASSPPLMGRKLSRQLRNKGEIEAETGRKKRIKEVLDKKDDMV